MNQSGRSDHLAGVTADKVNLRSFGMTDVGRRRPNNQDHFLVADLRKHVYVESSSVALGSSEIFGDPLGKLLLVADGMGGQNAGEVASQLAVSSVVQFLLNSMHWILRPSPQEVEHFVEELRAAANFSHKTVRDDMEQDPTRRGMGTTLTVAYIMWPMLYVLHVGDSRCYLCQEGKIEQLTDDQTLAHLLLQSGFLSEEEYEKSNYHNVLVSAIGVEDGPQANIYQRRLSPGDRVMICSDGVTNYVEPDEISKILTSNLDPEKSCRELVNLANERGGRDNVTAVVANCDPETSGEE